ncbi:MAG TPA: sulfite oxidase, partial [Thermomicrobiales bacterium]|nr:sulfite oxidase [Thermomicrobiales bacterium]
MDTGEVTRRAVLASGGAALAALAFLRLSEVALAFPARPDEVVLPWLDQPPPATDLPPDFVQLAWEELGSYLTPNDQFFVVHHFAVPDIAARDWRLEIGGLVERPRGFTLADLKALPRREITFTIECSGNNGFPDFVGAVGTATWAGTPLAPLLQEARIADRARDVVFWGADTGTETVRDMQIVEQFARAMAPEDALGPENLLAYEMNGQPLPRAHGFPVRLLAPGWFGVANVKWLQRIEVLGTRYEGRFMGRDYVTMRKAQQAGQTVVRFTSVGRALIKSAPAKVAVQDGAYRIVGAAWGAPIARVEVRVDNGPWASATLDEGKGAAHAWTIWTLDWPDPASGDHSITSRAIDTQGNVQPVPDDPLIANKITYWESNGQITRHVLIGAASDLAWASAFQKTTGRWPSQADRADR